MLHEHRRTRTSLCLIEGRRHPLRALTYHTPKDVVGPVSPLYFELFHDTGRVLIVSRT